MEWCLPGRSLVPCMWNTEFISTDTELLICYGPNYWPPNVGAREYNR
jgi:hypothetical protein